MKKIILFVLLSILPNFLMSACKKPKGTNLAGRTDFDKTGSDNSSNDSSDDKKEIRQKNGYIYGSDEYYKHEEEEKRQKIENETYDDSILVPRITQGWHYMHFWYKHDTDPYIVGDCGLYAVIRFLRHVEQIYPHNPDFKGLWKKYSNQELRNRLANLPGVRPECRKPREWLYQDELITLIYDLLGQHVRGVSFVLNPDPNTGGNFSALIFLK